MCFTNSNYAQARIWAKDLLVWNTVLWPLGYSDWQKLDAVVQLMAILYIVKIAWKNLTFWTALQNRKHQMPSSVKKPFTYTSLSPSPSFYRDDPIWQSADSCPREHKPQMIISEWMKKETFTLDTFALPIVLARPVEEVPGHVRLFPPPCCWCWCCPSRSWAGSSPRPSSSGRRAWGQTWRGRERSN